MIHLRARAVFDAYQEDVLHRIETMFPNIDLIATRGHSTPLDQLHIIGAYSMGFHYPEFNPQDVYAMADVELDGVMYKAFCWLRTWGECLHRGLMINPPLAAVVPFDYISHGINKKGQLIQASSHILDADLDPSVKACPIDFSQMVDDVPNIDRVAEIMQQAKASGVPIKDIVIEHGNGCVHVSLEKKGQGSSSK